MACSCATHYGALVAVVVSFLVASGGSAGVTAARYGPGQCSPVAALVSEHLYNSLFLHKDDPACPAKGFYTYASFINAARTFPKFAATGDLSTRKRELAAFFAQISHETTGGWATAPDGEYSWGLCFKEEISPASDYCDATDAQWPCYPGRSYHGRGPIQLSWNFNYGPAGRALGFDGLRNPEVVANCSETAFRTALWFWMTPRRPKPSCHEVMVGEYRASAADLAANRTPGFGLVTNIVNGGLECNRTDDARVNNRIGFYRRYCQIFNVDAGPNLDCAHQQPY
ncbi:chitinase 10 [Panicum miliaceum]|uniref:chitinase n=1 Tax=Panicum miliaceum TaxID=4540 RepID=A0A3L6R378_PANMI|nr:chitinase 10 [Panicum miliaceum]